MGNYVNGAAASGSITSNGASVDAARVPRRASATLRIQNSILAGSFGGADLVNNRSSGPARILSSGRNIVQSYRSAGGATKLGTRFLSVDPRLGALQNNGGLVPTMAIQKGSPAVDAGIRVRSAAATSPRNDARGPGFRRVVGRSIDLGAYEYQSLRTTTRLAVRVARSGFSQTVRLIARVRGKARGSNTPQGSVEFLSAGNVLATVPLVAGRAEYVTTASPGFHRRLAAVYTGFHKGDAGFDASASGTR